MSRLDRSDLILEIIYKIEEVLSGRGEILYLAGLGSKNTPSIFDNNPASLKLIHKPHNKRNLCHLTHEPESVEKFLLVLVKVIPVLASREMIAY